MSVGTFWSNWWMLSHPSDAGLFAHTWSLAIEVQFYVAWSVLLSILLVRRVRTRYIAGVVLAVVIGSAFWRAHIWAAAPNTLPKGAPALYQYVVGSQRSDLWHEWYYGSFSHIDGVFLGALIAFGVTDIRVRTALKERPRFVAAAGAGAIIIAVAVIAAASGTTTADFIPSWGLLLLELSVATLIACITLVPTMCISRGLGAKPLVWIGRRSYGIYVLHLPMLWFVTALGLADIFGSIGAQIRPWLALLLTLAAAALAYRFIEQPAIALGRRKANGIGTAHSNET